MIRACIIGVSGYGQVHYDLLMQARREGKVDIVGAAIINQDEESDKCAALRDVGCRIFDDYEVMLRDLAGRADFCMIPTGTPLHCSMTVAAVEAGMSVLVEKPAAGCLADVVQMQSSAQKTGRIVAVGYQHMYASSSLATKRHILSGTIGDLESVKCLVTWPRNHAYYNRNSWAGRLKMGDTEVNDSPFNNAVAHELMMMLFLAGAEERRAAVPVSVEAELYRANSIESADTACMRVETAEGVPILFHATHACRETFEPEMVIQGSRGTIVMTHTGAMVTPDDGPSIELPAEAAPNSMMSAVLDAVTGGDAFICDLELAAAQTWVVDKIRENCTISDVGGDSLGRADGYTYIRGIEESMRHAWDRGLLLREFGFRPCLNPVACSEKVV